VTVNTESLDRDALYAAIGGAWQRDVVPALEVFTRLPAVSPGFDPDWRTRGVLRRAVQMARDWALERGFPGASAEILEHDGASPLAVVEVPASGRNHTEATVLFYGHLDKQPWGEGWRIDATPWSAIREAGCLFGRGAVDDGYAFFSALVALEALRKAGGSHARFIGIFETGEESGSIGLPGYLEVLKDRIGRPDLVVALDAGAVNYEQLWLTVSLRAVVDCTLRVEVLKRPHHCGAASGIVPSSFRVVRRLLERLEDSNTGALLPEYLHVPIPEGRRSQLAEVAAELGDVLARPFAFAEGVKPVAADPLELLLNNFWRPTLAVLAQDGMPPLDRKAHLLRTHTAVELSFRFPPGLDVEVTKARLTDLLTRDPPHGAGVTVEWGSTCSGWDAPETAAWLAAASDGASRRFFGKPARSIGCGGAIPVINLLTRWYPEAQFFISGVCGPGANAHGPDECLVLDAAQNLTCCLAEVLHAHAIEGGTLQGGGNESS
jgi:acetylornithine deacetylase/succinyl-diaminopimelate desuccinylase-like protein